MITIFACPKPFTDPHIAIIQRNAIMSWVRLNPKPEIILFGNEKGVAEICVELQLHHMPEVNSNQYGTPFLNDIFEKAQRITSNHLMSYVNADMILMSDFISAVEKIKNYKDYFMMSGGRWGLSVIKPLQFVGSDWEKEIQSRVRQEGKFHFFGNDYFVFPRGFYKNMPPFAIGRAWFDGWLFWKARSLKAPVVDASEVIMAIHQDHDYAHAGAKDYVGLWDSEEAKRNFRLAGLRHHAFLLEATHLLTSRGLKKIWARKFWAQAKDLFIYRTGPLRSALGLSRHAHKKRICSW